MGRITTLEIAKIFIGVVLINAVVALITYSWVTDYDINNLPPPGFSRYTTIFTFFVTGHDYGEVYPKSIRLQVFGSLYIIFMTSGIVSFLFDF